MGGFVSGCACCGPTGDPTEACTNCTASLCYEVALAGITNNGCSSCEDFNGTWILKSHAYFSNCNTADNECGWCTDEKETDYCNPTGIGDLLRLQISSGGLATLTLTSRLNNVTLDNTVWTGTFPVEDNCNQELTMTLVSSGTKCADYPTTVTLTPIVCP